MQDNKISFRVTRETLPELLTIYHAHMPKTWENEYEQIIAAHMADMFYKLEGLRFKFRTQSTANIIMTVSEAMAFYQFWCKTNTAAWPLANVLICAWITKIDKRTKGDEIWIL